MVSPTLQFLVRSRSQCPSKIISHFHKPRHPYPPFLPSPIPQISKCTDQIHCSNRSESDSSKLNSYPLPVSSYVYPSFPFGFFLDAMSLPSLIPSEPKEEAAPDDSRTIRADSVKKKRKKKMNKHKLKKLRKRLRRKT